MANSIIAGNDFRLIIRAKKSTGAYLADMDLADVEDLRIYLTRAGRSKVLQSYTLDDEGHAVIYVSAGVVTNATYGIEMVGVYGGARLRAHNTSVFTISGHGGGNSGVLNDYYADIVFVINVAATDVYVQNAIEAHNENEASHPHLLQLIEEAGDVDDVQIDGESIVDENKIAHIDSSQFGKVDDVKINGTSVVSNKEANIAIPEKVSDLPNDADYATKSELTTGLDAKQDTITAVAEPTIADDGGNPSASVNFEGGELAFAFKNLKLRFSDLTAADKAELKGDKGDQGESVIVGEGDLPLANTLGNSSEKAITQQCVTAELTPLQLRNKLLTHSISADELFSDKNKYISSADGSIITASGVTNWYMTDYIPASVLLGMVFSLRNQSGADCVALYDANKTLVTHIQDSQTTVYGVYDFDALFAANPTTAFVRMGRNGALVVWKTSADTSLVDERDDEVRGLADGYQSTKILSVTKQSQSTQASARSTYVNFSLKAGRTYIFKVSVPNAGYMARSAAEIFSIRLYNHQVDTYDAQYEEALFVKNWIDFKGKDWYVVYTPQVEIKTIQFYLTYILPSNLDFTFNVYECLRQDVLFSTAVTPSTSSSTNIYPAVALKANHRYEFIVEPTDNLAFYGSAAGLTIRVYKNAVQTYDAEQVIAEYFITKAEYVNGNKYVFSYVAKENSAGMQFYSQRCTTVDVVRFEVIDHGLDAKETLTLVNDYYGEKISLGQKFGITKWMNNKSDGQGADAWDKYMFNAANGGTCKVYNMLTKTALQTFDFGCKDTDNHCNAINFGKEKNVSNIPYLYVSTGKFDVADENVCNVESITLSNGTFSSETVQRITLDHSGFEAAGYTPIVGAPSWMVDKERGYLWVFQARIKTVKSVMGSFKNNVYTATQFPLPLISQGNVTFTAADIIKQVVFPFDVYFTQGGTMRDGKIYYCFGVGDNADRPNAIRVYDTDRSIISSAIDLTGLVTTEVEDLFVSNGSLYLACVTTDVFKFDF